MADEHDADLDSQSHQLASQLMDLAAEHALNGQFLDQALQWLAERLAVDAAAVVRAEHGSWYPLASIGPVESLPTALLSDALDRGATAVEPPWLAAPLAERAATGELLLLRCDGPPDAPTPIDQPAQLLGAALHLVRDRRRDAQRIQRLEAVLEIAGQWNQHHEMIPLLEQMAETSTRLLGAERASIFLWDRPNRTLVGRPALGVEGGELRIADDAGIVGQVVQTGQTRRINAEEDQREIDRHVDKQLGYQTRTLLCVPLVGSGGARFGAFEMINKIDGNFTDDDQAALVELAAHAAIALENTQQYQQLLDSRKHVTDEAAQHVLLIGESPAIEALRSTVQRVANTELAILVTGENGTGKEVVSQMVHYLSARRDEPFIAVNCAAITETLLESELFGHEKGAFTDAHEARAGKFELANGGTLFLDEIGDLSPGGQAKLLRVLEEKVVVRVGGSRPIHTDARVLAATNQDLAGMVREKRFREDLYFRLNVVTLELPPLRDRGNDVLLLAEHFLGTFCAAARRQPPKFTAAARKRLRQHNWPGNVRELRNLMERLAYLTTGDRLDADELSFILAPGGGSPSAMSLDLPLADATRRFQVEYINRHIEAASGNMTEAATRLGLHRSNLYRKMNQLGMAEEA